MTQTTTETPSPPARGTVIHEHGHPTRLRAAVRVGAVIDLHPLRTQAPDYEGARAEAVEKFPGVTFIVPRLGEAP
jgi:hypothetical protein